MKDCQGCVLNNKALIVIFFILPDVPIPMVFRCLSISFLYKLSASFLYQHIWLGTAHKE